MSEPQTKSNMEPVYRVNNSVCLRESLFVDLDQESDFNYMMRPPFIWPWAETPDGFFCIAETDEEKEKPCNRVWSKTMMKNNAMELGDGQVFMPFDMPTALLPFPVLAAFYSVKIPKNVKLEDDKVNSERQTCSGVEGEQPEDRSGEQRSPEIEGLLDVTMTIEFQRPRAKVFQGMSEEEYQEIKTKIPGFGWNYNGWTVKSKWGEFDLPAVSDGELSVWNLPLEEGGSLPVKILPDNVEGFVSVESLPDALAVKTTRPKLEEFIPLEFLPEQLEVDDPNGYMTRAKPNTSKKPIKYKRSWPPDDNSDPSRTSESKSTSLQMGRRLGSGQHSEVLRGILTLSEPFVTLSAGDKVSLVVKMANDSNYDREHLKREAIAYNLLSSAWHKHLQEDWSGYIVCDGPYGFARRQLEDGDKPTVASLGAVVPKFFGLYEPVEKPEGSRPRPILLIEDCGQSVHDLRDSNVYQRLSTEERRGFECALACQVPAMFATLFQAGFVQRSPKWKNVTVQPGPLSLPHSERSYRTPSFRIIDFGRMHVREGTPGPSIGKLPELDHVTFRECAKGDMETVMSAMVGDRLKCMERRCYCYFTFPSNMDQPECQKRDIH